MRRLLNTKKIGHSGTLDPMAEGVLPVFVGAATKAVDFCPDTDKEYRAAFRLGVATDTQDITGNVVYENSAFVPRNRLWDTMRGFVGEIEQTPPMYSAVKINGKRLYDLAREGKEVEREPRKVTVYSLNIEKFEEGEGVITVSCTKGTYVRTLIHDIGMEIGTGAVMTALQRTRSNGFSVEDCRKLTELREIFDTAPEKLKQFLMPIDRLFDCYPNAYLDEKQTEMFKNGAALNADLVRFDKIYNGLYSLYDSSGRMVALVKIQRDHSLSAVQRFNYDD
jgi:tRNA pseudouridine55 synthase